LTTSFLVLHRTVADVTRQWFAGLVYSLRGLVVCDLFNVHIVTSIDQSLMFDRFLKPTRMAWARFQFDVRLLMAGALGLDSEAHTSRGRG
jgi:hypothetical protein